MIGAVIDIGSNLELAPIKMRIALVSGGSVHVIRMVSRDVSCDAVIFIAGIMALRRRSR